MAVTRPKVKVPLVVMVLAACQRHGVHVHIQFRLGQVVVLPLLQNAVRGQTGHLAALFQINQLPVSDGGGAGLAAAGAVGVVDVIADLRLGQHHVLHIGLHAGP